MKNKLNQPDVETSTTRQPIHIDMSDERIEDVVFLPYVKAKEFKPIQPVLTIEEVKKEWKEDGWEWKEDYCYYKGCEYERYCISKKFGSDEKIIVLEEYNKKIYLFYGYETFDNEGYKVFENKSFKMSFKELQRITKTVIALKWEV